MRANSASFGVQSLFFILMAASAVVSTILAAIAATIAARDGLFPTLTKQPATHTHNVCSNMDVGIQEYRFPIALPVGFTQRGISFSSSELRVYFRLYCSGSNVTVAGFAGLIPNDTDTYFGPAAFYYYRPPTQLRGEVNLSVTVTTDGKGITQPLLWQVESSSDSGLWPFKGTLGATTKQLSLTARSSSVLHPLPLLTCGSSGGSSSNGGGMVLENQALHGMEFKPGIWNVVTTTNPNLIPPEKMARLLLLHARHHQGLGFTGTILSCNPDEALVLAAMPQIQEAITQARLIIWPWVWDEQHPLKSTTSTHPATTANNNDSGDERPGSKSSGITHNSQRKVKVRPYFWQVPKNQLVLLAALGRNLQLAFFDLDEYLMLPQGGTLQSSNCQQPHLDKPCVGWEYVRYAGLTANCSAASELDCWEQAAAGSTTAANAFGSTGAAAAVPVYGVSVVVARCPCSQGKTLVQPDSVPDTNVHMSTAAPWGMICQVQPTCGYLLHMQSLMGTVRPWGDRKTVQHAHGQWLVNAGGVGTLHFASDQEKLKAHGECDIFELLPKCAQV